MLTSPDGERLTHAVAQRLSAFGMQVIAYDPFLTPERAVELGVEKVELDQLLARAEAAEAEAAEAEAHEVDDARRRYAARGVWGRVQAPARRQPLLQKGGSGRAGGRAALRTYRA